MQIDRIDLETKKKKNGVIIVPHILTDLFPQLFTMLWSFRIILVKELIQGLGRCPISRPRQVRTDIVTGLTLRGGKLTRSDIAK